MITAICAALLLGGSTPSVRAEVAIPLPRGVGALGAPTRVGVGSSTLSVQSFITTMDPEELITFYEQALSRAGWRLGMLPWQASHAEITRRFEKTMKYSSSTLSDDQRKQGQDRLKQFQRTAQQMRQQLYATMGPDHVIVNIWAMGEAGTAVFLNRWTGDESWMDGQHPGGLPSANICCTGEALPAQGEGLPANLPRYPGATAVARSASADHRRTTVLLMTHDPVDQIAAYYRTQMSANGWTSLGQEQVTTSAAGGTSHALLYQDAQRVCAVTIDGGLASSAKAPQTLVTLALVPKAAMPTGAR